MGEKQPKHETGHPGNDISTELIKKLIDRVDLQPKDEKKGQESA